MKIGVTVVVMVFVIRLEACDNISGSPSSKSIWETGSSVGEGGLESEVGGGVASGMA
jgi:hypothetical protein